MGVSLTSQKEKSKWPIGIGKDALPRKTQTLTTVT